MKFWVELCLLYILIQRHLCSVSRIHRQPQSPRIFPDYLFLPFVNRLSYWSLKYLPLLYSCYSGRVVRRAISPNIFSGQSWTWNSCQLVLVLHQIIDDIAPQNCSLSLWGRSPPASYYPNSSYNSVITYTRVSVSRPQCYWGWNWRKKTDCCYLTFHPDS